jgi:ammonia channel protein AmtB
MTDNQSSDSFMRWMFNWAFMAVAVTIPAGGMAERVAFLGYFCYTLLFTVRGWVGGWAGGCGRKPVSICR